MILIAHRGNFNGKFESYENEPTYIDMAIKAGYDVEVDVWYVNGVLYLGHDKPQYGVDFRWFRDRFMNLWVHCKNVDALIFFRNCGYNINYFWHETDTVTLTSQQYIWAYPGNQPIKGSIAVMPSLNNETIKNCIGICDDDVSKYKTKDIYDK
jgi:hypothetical protein